MTWWRYFLESDQVHDSRLFAKRGRPGGRHASCSTHCEVNRLCLVTHDPADRRAQAHSRALTTTPGARSGPATSRRRGKPPTSGACPGEGISYEVPGATPVSSIDLEATREERERINEDLRERQVAIWLIEHSPPGSGIVKVNPLFDFPAETDEAATKEPVS